MILGEPADGGDPACVAGEELIDHSASPPDGMVGPTAVFGEDDSADANVPGGQRSVKEGRVVVTVNNVGSVCSDNPGDARYL